MAFSNSGLGMVHAMAHSLGGFYNLPHGVCNSILLPYVMEFNGRSAEVQKRYKLIADSLEIQGNRELSPKAATTACIEYIRNLCRQVEIPKSFKEFNIRKEDFNALADLSLVDTCMPANPVQPTKEEVIAIYNLAC
jgi:alcohol dehydrogenase